jgi:hypothetical protein
MVIFQNGNYAKHIISFVSAVKIQISPLKSPGESRSGVRPIVEKKMKDKRIQSVA